MWPVDYEKCMLSLKEKLLIEEFLRKKDKYKALNIVRSTWFWVLTYEPKHKDISTISENIQLLVKWIKEDRFKDQLPDPSSDKKRREILFWDWVCQYIAGLFEPNLFKCESKEEAIQFYKLFRKNVPLIQFGIKIVDEKDLNLYKIQSRTRN